MEVGNAGAGMTRSTAKKICDAIARPGRIVRKPQPGDFFLYGSKADMSKVEVVVVRPRSRIVKK